MYNVKQVTYADGSCLVQVSDYAANHKAGNRKKKSDLFVFERTEEEKIRSFENSVKRSKKNVEDYGLSNKWEYFLTLTLDPEKVNGLCYEEAKSALEKYLDSFRKRHPNVKYLCVLEKGEKHGRWHAHLLVGNCKLKLVDSGRKTRDHQKIYNLDTSEYNLGFTTVTYVKSSMAAGKYISKYIGKALGNVPENAKRYWATKNLDSAEKEAIKYYLDYKEKETLISILKRFCSLFNEKYVPVIDNTFRYFRFDSYFDVGEILTELTAA